MGTAQWALIISGVAVAISLLNLWWNIRSRFIHPKPRIGVRLELISRGVFQVNAGSLFPSLRRLERDGLIKGVWRITENNRRAKYYSLTTQGRAKLKQETRDWEVQTTAIHRILRASLGEL